MANILLIEPDSLQARNYRHVLKSAGHTVRWQPDGQLAINSVDEHLPDVIVLELQLDSHNGLEFLYELRSYPEWQQISVIIQSIVRPTMLAHRGQAFASLGISDYLYKPLSKLHRLVRAVEQVTQVSTL